MKNSKSLWILYNKTVSVRKAKKTTPPFGVCSSSLDFCFFIDISYTFQVAAKKIFYTRVRYSDKKTRMRCLLLIIVDILPSCGAQ